MQCACAILPSVACLALQNFSTLSKKGTIFEKKSHWTQDVSWFFLKLLSETFLILKRIERGMIEKFYWSSCKVPLVLSDCMKLEFSRQIFEKYSNIIFHENLPSGSRVVPWGQRTDMTKFIVAFRNSANAPKNSTLFLLLDGLFPKKQTNAKYFLWRHCTGSWKRNH
jgi:hypothetical protein